VTIQYASLPETKSTITHNGARLAHSIWRLHYRMEDRGFESRQGLGTFLFTTASRPALGPTQPPIQRVPGALSLGVLRPGCEADHSPPASAGVKEWWELYLHSPNTPSWRDAHLKHRDNFTILLYIYWHSGLPQMRHVQWVAKRKMLLYWTYLRIPVILTHRKRSPWQQQIFWGTFHRPFPSPTPPHRACSRPAVPFVISSTCIAPPG
jgi:hypothetical protein